MLQKAGPQSARSPWESAALWPGESGNRVGMERMTSHGKSRRKAQERGNRSAGEGKRVALGFLAERKREADESWTPHFIRTEHRAQPHLLLR